MYMPFEVEYVQGI